MNRLARTKGRDIKTIYSMQVKESETRMLHKVFYRAAVVFPRRQTVKRHRPLAGLKHHQRSHVSTSHRPPIHSKSSTATPIKSTCLLTYSPVFLLFTLPLTTQHCLHPLRNPRLCPSYHMTKRQLSEAEAHPSSPSKKLMTVSVQSAQTHHPSSATGHQH